MTVTKNEAKREISDRFHSIFFSSFLRLESESTAIWEEPSPFLFSFLYGEREKKLSKEEDYYLFSQGRGNWQTNKKFKNRLNKKTSCTKCENGTKKKA